MILIVILGGPKSGKTTLARFLSFAFEHRIKIVDDMTINRCLQMKQHELPAVGAKVLVWMFQSMQDKAVIEAYVRGLSSWFLHVFVLELR